MTRCAKMPNNCWGKYRRVAVVETSLPAGIEPRMISKRARGVVRIYHDFGALNVGKTDRCAYRRALAGATSLANAMNMASVLNRKRPAGSVTET